MATTLILVRHAVHGLVDRVLCGRSPSVHLSEEGRQQAVLLGQRLRPLRPAAVYSSPLARAQETAVCIGPPTIADSLNEIDFGDWNGCEFSTLRDDLDWRRWNAERGSARPPGGESMREAQVRAMRWALDAAGRHADATIVAVSHCDIIRAMVCAVLGLSLDHYAGFEVSPASCTTITLWRGGASVLRMNEGVAT